MVVKALVTTLTAYPPGTLVQLSNGRSGRVIRVNEQDRVRPMVRLFDDHVSPDEAEISDLAAHRNCHVQEAINPRTTPPQVVKYFSGRHRAGIAVASPAAAFWCSCSAMIASLMEVLEGMTAVAVIL
jgi:hypothetical protein